MSKKLENKLDRLRDELEFVEEQVTSAEKLLKRVRKRFNKVCDELRKELKIK